MLQELQQKKQLRKVDETEKKYATELVKASAASEKQQLAEYMKRVREADIDFWYPLIKDLTYETAFIPLSIEEAKAMLKAHEVVRKGLPVEGEPRQILGALALCLDAHIAAWGEHGCFAKLSSRSPKDAAAFSNNTRAHFASLVAEERAKGSEPSDNFKLIALNRAHIEAMRVTSGEQLVFQLFAASDRIEEDLRLALEDTAQFSQNVILRKWTPIPIEYEFRGFVSNGRLTALSQYYQCCYFPHLVEQRAKIAAQIQTFWEQTLKPLLPFENIIVDFAVDLETNRALVIEMNPFNNFVGCGTDAALFDWRKDTQVLMEGPFEFRVEMEPARDVKKLLSESFRKMLAEV